MSVKGAILPGLNEVLFSEQSTRGGGSSASRSFALDSRGTHSAVGIFVGSCQRLPLPQISEVVADSSKIPSQEAAVDEEFNVESECVACRIHATSSSHLLLLRHDACDILLYVDAIKYLSTVMSDERSRHHGVSYPSNNTFFTTYRT